MKADNEKSAVRYNNDNQPPIWGPHPATCKDAKRLGTKYYFSDKPCRRGHVAPRYAHGSCAACKAEDRANNRDKNRVEAKIWRENNPDKVRGYHKKKSESGYGKLYYSLNREEQIAKSLKWNNDNPEMAKASNKRWREAHKDVINAKIRQKRNDNIEEARAKDKAWRDANKEKHAQNSREWRKNNPEKRRVIDRNKKLRRRGAEGSHTLADVEAILKRQKYKCLECGISVRKDYHIDHFMPLALGGTNWPHNLQVLCPTCNMEKHATDPLVWARRKGRLV